MVLTVSSRSLRQHGGNGATPPLLSPEKEKSVSERPTARILDSNRRHLEKAYLEEWLLVGGGSSEEQNVTDVPMITRQGARQLKRERSEGDHGFTINEAAVHRHEKYSFKEYFNLGPCTSW